MSFWWHGWWLNCFNLLAMTKIRRAGGSRVDYVITHDYIIIKWSRDTHRSPRHRGLYVPHSSGLKDDNGMNSGVKILGQYPVA